MFCCYLPKYGQLLSVRYNIFEIQAFSIILPLALETALLLNGRWEGNESRVALIRQITWPQRQPVSHCLFLLK